MCCFTGIGFFNQNEAVSKCCHFSSTHIYITFTTLSRVTYILTFIQLSKVWFKKNPKKPKYLKDLYLLMWRIPEWAVTLKTVRITKSALISFKKDNLICIVVLLLQKIITFWIMELKPLTCCCGCFHAQRSNDFH